ncbi:MAG TPA: hypothetical protein VFR37_15830 [Longimicrobium sp.]|nr:hypothetical protein [Longimicrobium sp.]
MHPYASRPIRFHGVREHRGWRIKVYSIVYDAHGPDWGRFREGRELAMEALPEPEGEEGRPGVGFAIAHQGRNADYFVLGWWDRENELPLRIFVREGGEGWRPAQGSESICVWDLQVLWFEREAYVATLMNLACADPAAAYLARGLDLEPRDEQTIRR